MTEIKQIIELANKLSEVRKDIAKLDEVYEETAGPLKKLRDELQSTLLVELKENNLTSLKDSEGVSYAKSSKPVFEFLNELEAFKWAYVMRYVQIDKKMVSEKLKELPQLPEWVRKTETEYISIRNSKKNE